MVSLLHIPRPAHPTIFNKLTRYPKLASHPRLARPFQQGWARDFRKHFSATHRSVHNYETMSQCHAGWQVNRRIFPAGAQKHIFQNSIVVTVVVVVLVLSFWLRQWLAMDGRFRWVWLRTSCSLWCEAWMMEQNVISIRPVRRSSVVLPDTMLGEWK